MPIALIARKDLPVKDFKEFVAYAKANQAKMQFGSAGAGSATHLGCVLLNYMIGVNITHVPYRGTGPAMQDLIGGRIDYICEVVTTIKSQLDGGTIKGIAMLDSKRSPALPNLPTAEEQGTKDLIAYTWNAIFLPKGAPDADREEAQRRDAGGDARAGGEGQAGGARRRDRAGRSGHARLSRQARQGRDREMGGADQGERRHGGVIPLAGSN